MHTPLYREVIKEAFEITRRKRYLWLFGLLAAFLGNGGAYELFTKVFSQIINSSLTFMDSVKTLLTGWRTLPWAPDTASLAFVLIILLLGVGILFLVAILLSHGALIISCAKIYKGKDAPQTKMWINAWQSFWPLAAVVVSFKVLILASVGLAAWPLHLILSGKAGTWLVILFPVIFVAVICFILICSFVSFYGASFVLIDRLDVVEAVSRSWQIFIDHWLVNIEMAGITFLASLGAGVIGIIGVIIIVVPFSLIGALSIFYAVPVLGLVSIFISSVLMLMLIFYIGSLLAVFQTAAWVILFMRMREGRAGSKLLRWLKVIKSSRAGL